VHRESPQPTGFWPPPAPQQYRFEGFPFCLPRQSAAQERQSSPAAGSQIPLPQADPVPEMQSLGQLVQVSCPNVPSTSQIPLSLQAKQSPHRA